ncbi:MAG: branched-chain amino acid ABC transporter permease [Fusobacteriaceae bacterium]|jgi:branched-chain amino acid transport system permease protein|nr:branched-chain amino acid ABC transporter permease [Fusobacteriaceae bacterium]
MQLQIILNGLALGSVYALIATGFSLIFNILKFSNFAHGATMAFCAFAGYFVAAANKMGLVPTIAVAVATGGLVALCGEFVAFRSITVRNASPIYYFVSSITLGTLLEGLVTIKAGANFYNYPLFFKKRIMKFHGLVISTSDVIMFCCSAAALLILVWVIRKTRLGRGLRAVSFDRDTAGLMGINVIRTIQFAFLLSGMLAGLAGVFLGINYTLYPTLGSLVVKGFIASVIGGLGSIAGALIGAVLLGLAETQLVNLVGSTLTPVLTFVIMLVFLLLRPRGIAGSNIQEKA